MPPRIMLETSLSSPNLQSSSISVSHFPPEIIFDFADRCQIEDLLSLCRTSTFIGAVGTRVLYQKITLSSAPMAIRCFQTMLTRSASALAVRSLHMYAARSIPLCPALTQGLAFAEIFK